MAEDRIGEALKFSPGDSKVMRRAVLTYETLGERDRAIETLRTAGPELLHELERHPDLDALARDVRFQQLVAANSTGEK